MTRKTTPLVNLLQAVKNSFVQYDNQGTRHWTWEVAAQDLSYQIGSLQKVILHIGNYRWANGKDKDVLEANFRDELADILAEVLYIASERGIDMNRHSQGRGSSDYAHRCGWPLDRNEAH